MSRHTARKERWTQVSAKEFRSLFGVVHYRAGAWEGTVLFEQLEPDPAGASWRPQQQYAGRFKRPRNAMIAVEGKAREVCRRQADQVRIAFTD
jgi:hypothetical protein